MWLDTRLITDTSTDFQSLSLERRAIEIDKHQRNVAPDESPSRDQMVRPSSSHETEDAEHVFRKITWCNLKPIPGAIRTKVGPRHRYRGEILQAEDSFD